MLEINPAALLIQIANFLILLFLLNKLLFKPIRSVLAERAGKIQTLAEAAGSFEARASSSEREIRDGREASRRAGLAEKDRLKGEAQEEERRVMEEALKASSRKVEEARKQAEASMASVREALNVQVEALSREAAATILGRSVR